MALHFKHIKMYEYDLKNAININDAPLGGGWDSKTRRETYLKAMVMPMVMSMVMPIVMPMVMPMVIPMVMVMVIFKSESSSKLYYNITLQ